MEIKLKDVEDDEYQQYYDCSNLRIFEFFPKCVRVGSVSSNDSGHGSYAQHDTSSSSSVYTAADCRLLQQISNTAATRNLNTQCNTRALSPHTLHPATTSNTTMNAPLPPLPLAPTQNNTTPQPSLTPTPPPFLMRGQNLQMFTRNGGGGTTPPPLQQLQNRPLSPPLQQANMPPPYATAAAMLHHNHRHSNMHGKFVGNFYWNSGYNGGF